MNYFEQYINDFVTLWTAVFSKVQQHSSEQKFCPKYWTISDWLPLEQHPMGLMLVLAMLIGWGGCFFHITCDYARKALGSALMAWLYMVSLVFYATLEQEHFRPVTVETSVPQEKGKRHSVVLLCSVQDSEVVWSRWCTIWGCCHWPVPFSLFLCAVRL